MKIHNLQAMDSMSALDGVRPMGAKQAKGDDFANTLMDVLKEVNQAQMESRAKQTDVQTGQPVDLHDVMIAMERAGIAMNLTMAVRNKVLEAYQEISRTQI